MSKPVICIPKDVSSNSLVLTENTIEERWKRICLIDISLTSDEINLGLGLISTYLVEKHFNHEIVVIKKRNELAEKIPIGYSLYCFPLFHSNYSEVFSAARIIKERNSHAFICIGGKLATDSYTEVFSSCTEIDLVVCGAGEYPVYELAKLASTGGLCLDAIELISGIRSKRGGWSSTCEREPVPIGWARRYNLEKPAANPLSAVSIITASGCKNNCAFCNGSSGAYLRPRDIYDVVAEIRQISARYGRSFFHFCDRDLMYQEALTSRFMQLCKILAEQGGNHAYYCNVDAINLVDVPCETFGLIKKAGFNSIELDVNSCVDAANSCTVLTSKTLSQLVAALHGEGIDTVFSHIMFSCMIDIESIVANYERLKAIKSCYISNFISQQPIYYKSRLYYLALKNGLLGNDYSYLSPYAYSFLDKDVKALYCEVSRMNNFGIGEIGLDFIDFSHYFNTIADTTKQDFMSKMIAIKDDFNNAIVNLFDDLFYLKINPAKTDATINEIRKIGDEARELKLNVIWRERKNGKSK